MRTLSWIDFVLGLWLIAAAFIFSFGQAPSMAEELVLGGIIAWFAWRAARDTPPASATRSWILVLAGLWTLLAPWILPYAVPAARVNDIAVGGAVLVLAFITAVYRNVRVRTRQP